MQITKEDLIRMIAHAWDKAIQIVGGPEENGKSAGSIHRLRSEKWVDCLAGEFQREYQGSERKHRVFWKRNCCNKTTFYMNEFLFDVMVGRIGTVKSFQHKPQNLEYIDHCEWAIESELDDSNSRQIVVDMSKLVVAAAKNKLFIASQSDKEDRIKEMAKDIAKNSSGNFYFCFIPHPKDWNGSDRPRLLEF